MRPIFTWSGRITILVSFCPRRISNCLHVYSFISLSTLRVRIQSLPLTSHGSSLPRVEPYTVRPHWELKSLCFAYVTFFRFLMVVLETNYLRMYRTSLRQIFKIGTVPIWVNIIILTFSQLLKGFCYGSRFVAWIGKNWLLCAASFCMLAFHNWWQWMHALTPLMIPVCLIKIWWTLVQ